MPLIVDEVARRTLITCNPNSSMFEVAKLMLEHNVGSVLVKDSGEEIIGIITKNDILRQLIAGKDLKSIIAKNVMSHPVASCNKTDTIEDALKKFGNYSRLVVKDETGKVVGVAKKKIVERFATVSLAYDFVQRRVRRAGD